MQILEIGGGSIFSATEVQNEESAEISLARTKGARPHRICVSARLTRIRGNYQYENDRKHDQRFVCERSIEYRNRHRRVVVRRVSFSELQEKRAGLSSPIGVDKSSP